MPVFVSRDQMLANLSYLQGGFSARVMTGDTHTSTLVDAITDTSGIHVGDEVIGAGIPAGATVASKTTTSVTLSNAATATAAGVTLAFVRALGTPLSAMKVELIKADVPADQMTDLVALAAAKADFGGYAALTAQEFIGPVVNDDGRFELLSPLFSWVKDSSPGANDIYGFYVTDAGGTNLIFSGKFADGAQHMVSAGDVVAFSVPYDMEGPTAEIITTE